MAKDMTADNMLSIAIRVFFGVYWFFDNLNILSKIKILDFDSKKMAKWGATFWLLALLTNLILLIKQLAANLKKTGELQKIYYAASSENEAKERKKDMLSSVAKRQDIVLNIIKVGGDVIPAGQTAELFSSLFGFNANDTWCGLGGLVSAILTSYQLYD